MEHLKIEKYLNQALNMALSINGESTYTNSFFVEVKEDGFLFVPRTPAGYLIDDELYQKIFIIANASLYPRYTLLKQNSAYFVPLQTEDIHVQRALFFPWFKGISERLVISNLTDYVKENQIARINIMKNLSIDYNKVTGIIIAGNSGSGKSYFLTYLLEILSTISELIIVDPKFDSPSRWAKIHGIAVIHPESNRSKSDFVSQVNDSLSSVLSIIYQRQEILYENPAHKFEHLTVVIDEVLALSEGVNKQIKDSFMSLLSSIALLGRATCCHLVLVSQRFDFNAVPVSVREQANILVQIGNINSKTIQFLFPDLNPEGIVIPIGKGTGLIQVIDNEHPYQVLPLLTPTFYTERGIL
ncbi:TPA: cell division protein FtsK [Listeria monocytogenes]|uniref:cell division protein FtsK n=1 Tax=Listeria monocytogenes TaxID=1639 RepID=UPI001C28A02B|nr:cell division protein FtsK [Listeria monocytogenes]MCD1671247.1 cell division protein FtsK [Listeria monocytogenes]MCD1705760.1 cell division protein FtsK [Listeria monocytogenes]MCD1714690.1 cell division protein FtsK [Listeria monocytogenes]MCD1726220.1 cell division protein FtsK [Listeria monocytogenes]MCD1839859.1 cell division protein FtsK [Listeria monocytogenes]